MKTRLIFLAISALSFGASAQSLETLEPTGLASMTKLEVGLQGIGVGYEIPLSKKLSVNLSAGLGGGYSIDQNDFANGFNSRLIIDEPVAYFRSEVKYTYNREKRLAKGKPMWSNAGNYVAYQAKYTTRRVFDGVDTGTPLNKTLLNEVHWGIQRPLGQKFIFNTHVGLGYAADFDFKNSQLYPAAGAQFSYIISKSRRLF
ncbi:hypothetical protein [uncultured Pontibacter sp.]|uniref:hypothetical protein n=1 Tax=uncultured Pontibacter sp. TaxID=453356 RepID=UPI0026159DD5|nr:hypothetical protein [uncultured Pontibacter sp.]